jgi:hypothetical protein
MYFLSAHSIPIMPNRNAEKNHHTPSLYCVSHPQYALINPVLHRHRYTSCPVPFDPPLINAGSHAEASVPIGGYLCPSCSIRGPHVHHCSDGMLDMTPETCLPQPHQVVLSGWVSVDADGVLVMGCGMEMARREGEGRGFENDVRHESQAAFLHMLGVGGETEMEIWSFGGDGVNVIVE